MYVLISFDGYPDCMYPSLEYSSYFIIYFMIYLVLVLLLFLPIPVAIVFDSFRSQRCKIVLYDRIK
jgi:hypothetical protein